MFYNFAPPRSIAKRRRVDRACEFCRRHRVRCDASTPCAQCVANKAVCSRSQRTHARSNRDALVSDVAKESPSRASPIDRVCTSGSKALQQQVVPVNNQVDSTLEFVNRINTFCSSVFLQCIPHNDDPGPFRSPFCPGTVEETESTKCDLSPTQIDRLISIFLTRLHPQIPIICEEDLQPSNSLPEYVALRDAITAYTMQFVFHSGLHSRLLGLQWKQFDTGNRRSRVVGMPYFQRCLASCTQYTMFSDPSVITLKCYCIITMYLLDTGQHHAAYNIIGLAVRMAQSLNLDETGLPGLALEESERSPIWWTLVHLDFRCSRYHGKPVTTQYAISKDLLQYSLSMTSVGQNCSPYYFYSLRLTCAALAVLDSVTHNMAREKDHDIETRARVLSENMQLIHYWKEAVQKEHSFKHLRLNALSPSLPGDIASPGVEEDDYMTHLPIDIQLNTLLELQYHDTIISLHRSFIEFPSTPSGLQKSHHAKSHVATAAQHALTAIRIIHSRMSQHDVFYGSSELYQYQWNAVLTLIGFMLAYPSYARQTVLRHVNLALAAFEFGGRQSDAAARAASHTRFLRDKVAELNDIRCIDYQPQLEPDTELQGLAEDLDLGQELDWTNFIDSALWSTYSDQVHDAFDLDSFLKQSITDVVPEA
ncbi:uncharacterized protein TRUGW13939_03917 [Talaromyces rugulosus]|uniref:Zn(2)-C6 fungal-type domain-containing protein n=1 Tax=Talaromyces rugulosus TaxID=121627 RepID=A0A7H8QS48_TALRU|nr:uncharacterized protein TRUGW13939_03917 [Talaromyces rugulosus]QKX56810.1 hypothetical protein TRUGW13939_03917 [Talaromyces rugulosus]